ncbi:MAG TPA: HAMP domain-containing sensor histidine kinase [Vicinamibacterales bacterium]
MFSKRLWRGRSRGLTLLLLAVAVPPAAALVWLGWLLLQQDRALLAQRDFERRQAAAQTAVRSLELSLAAAERAVFAGPVPHGMVRLVLTPERVDAQPADRVLWLPAMRRVELADDRRFADAERLEFQGGVGRALTIYEAAARSPKPEVRAGALLRLARVRRSQARWDDALIAYRKLATIQDVTIAGAPADLQARRGSGAVLQASNRTQELAREAAALEADLLAGRWTLDRAAWELTAADVERWTGQRVPVAAERRMFSAVAATLSAGSPLESTARRLSVVVEGVPVTVLWRAEGDRASALAISPAVLHAWVGGALGNGARAAGHLSLLGSTGELLAGPAIKPGAQVVKASASETGLPWTVVLDPGDSSSESADMAGRERLLSAGLAAILLLLAGGSYFLWRVMQRELAVARLQTDFVAAVSHEFRTPLTSLRHVAELLEEDDDMPPARRRTFYDAIGRNTERLHRLVESLLDFARMESHRQPYHLQPVDSAALVADVVAEFQKESVASGFTITLAIEVPAPVRADTLSLTNALWNLLDNAVKYSPNNRSIEVAVRQHRRGIAISVRDEGLGVPAPERAEIFGRFVRGATASRLGIRGTGLGLAMVSHIVEAHGGAIELVSAEGIGSTFTIVLPLARFTTEDTHEARSLVAQDLPSASSGSSAFES